MRSPHVIQTLLEYLFMAAGLSAVIVGGVLAVFSIVAERKRRRKPPSTFAKCLAIHAYFAARPGGLS